MASAKVEYIPQPSNSSAVLMDGAQKRWGVYSSGHLEV